ncbi:MAG: FxsA family protein [Ornithinimicrobium sp.]
MATSADQTPGAGRSPTRRRGRWIFALLLLIPLLEITTIILVGQAIGAWWTFGALIALSVIGAWLVHREGRRTWGRLREALRQGQAPAKELTDAGLVLVGGAMLLTPGFLTDALGLFFVLPLTRPITRAWLQTVVASRLLGSFAPTGSESRGRRSAGAARGEVIEGEVIQEPDPKPPGGRSSLGPDARG